MSLLRYRWKRRCAQTTSFLSMSIFIKFWGRENNTFFCVEERRVASIYFICLQVHLRNKTFNGLRMNKKVWAWASCTIFFLDGSWKGKLLTLKWFLFQEPLRASSFHVKLFFREAFSNSRTTNWFLLPERKNSEWQLRRISSHDFFEKVHFINDVPLNAFRCFFMWNFHFNSPVLIKSNPYMRLDSHFKNRQTLIQNGVCTC